MNTLKLKTAFVFTIATLFCFTLSAQDYTFKVTSVKGNATADGSKLMVGSKIQKGATIKVESGTLLNVAHNNGKTLTVSKVGTYKVDDLAKGCAAKSGSLSEKYAAFVLNELTAGKTDGIGANNMSKTGSVDRAIPKALAFNAPGDKKTKVANAEVTLRWFADENAPVAIPEGASVDNYNFQVKDLMDNVLYETTTTESFVTINLAEEKFKSSVGSQLMYQVTANVGDNSYGSLEHMLVRVSNEEAIQIKQDVETLASDNSTINKLILAKYFEDHGLYANAMFAYEEAIKMSESNEMYENMYQAFLDRNYLSKKAKQMGSKKTNAETKKENK